MERSEKERSCYLPHGVIQRCSVLYFGKCRKRKLCPQSPGRYRVLYKINTWDRPSGCWSLGNKWNCPRKIWLMRRWLGFFNLALFNSISHYSPSSHTPWWLSPDRISHCLLCVLITFCTYNCCSTWDCLHIQHLPQVGYLVSYSSLCHEHNPLPDPLYSFSVHQMLESYAVISMWKLVIVTHRGNILNCYYNQMKSYLIL